jgi:hypothetical protein
MFININEGAEVSIQFWIALVITVVRVWTTFFYSQKLQNYLLTVTSDSLSREGERQLK